MIEIITGFFVFCLVLFIYLHVQFHLKTSNDLEIYEVDQASKDKLEEICDIRQPVLFDFENQKIIETSNKDYILSNYHAFEIKIFLKIIRIFYKKQELLKIYNTTTNF
jgi:hypothetical protein